MQSKINMPVDLEKENSVPSIDSELGPIILSDHADLYTHRCRRLGCREGSCLRDLRFSELACTTGMGADARQKLYEEYIVRSC